MCNNIDHHTWASSLLMSSESASGTKILFAVGDAWSTSISGGEMFAEAAWLSETSLRKDWTAAWVTEVRRLAASSIPNAAEGMDVLFWVSTLPVACSSTRSEESSRPSLSLGCEHDRERRIYGIGQMTTIRFAGSDRQLLGAPESLAVLYCRPGVLWKRPMGPSNDLTFKQML